MEWFEWAFVVPILGWLGREIWSNISQNKFMRKQSENEHQYFKKRLIFEQKNEIYKELYKRIKHMVGILNDFNFFDDRTMTYNLNALNKHISDTPEPYRLVDNETITHYYASDEGLRIKVNISYYLEVAEKSYLDFKNYAAEQNYILSKEENEVIKEIDINRNELVNYIKGIWIYLDKNEDVDLDIVREHFSDEYENRFNKLDQLIYKFSATIRKEMFL